MNLSASNYSDRLTLKPDDAKRLHDALTKGGALQFKIVEADRSTTQYDFSIKSANYFENAAKKLEAAGEIKPDA